MLLWWRACAFTPPFVVGSLPTRERVIDLHCHIACLDTAQGCYVSPALRDSLRFPIYLRLMHIEDVSRADVAAYVSAQLRRSRHVGRAVLLALDGVVRDGRVSRRASEIIVPNDFVYQQVRRHENLLFGASINPYREDALQALARVYAQGAVLIKWIPSIMNIDPADPALVPFYREMARLGLPLLTHTGSEHAFTHADDRLADPRRLALPLSLGVTVIAAHSAGSGRQGGMRNFDRLLPMFARYPRLYADISSLTQLNKIFVMKDVLRHREIHERLLYGSDWPLSVFPLVSPWYFSDRLDLRTMWRLARIGHVWDADVRLKHALGIPAAVFSRAGQVLRLPDTGGREQYSHADELGQGGAHAQP